MDSMHKGNPIASAITFTPVDLDPDSLKILRDAGFVWDSHLAAFRRGRDDHSMIGYGFLREQKLVINSTLDNAERAGQLQRLRILVQSLD